MCSVDRVCKPGYKRRPNAEASLRLDKADLMRHEAAGITVDRYPKILNMGGSNLSLTYHFEPGSIKDGVTLVIPLTVLNQIDGRRCEWLVPGMCEEKTLLLLKSLHKNYDVTACPCPITPRALCSA
jgi:ATP-dependent helicase HrpA